MKLAARSAMARTTSALITAGLVVAAVGACGSDKTGDPAPAGPDVSNLDVGNYQTTPRVVGNAKNFKQARVRESQRLADYVALPFEADPTYVKDNTNGIRPHIVLNRKGMGDLVINDTFDDVAKDLLAGWTNRWSTQETPDHKDRTLSIAVMEFPDAKTAASVGPTLENDDFTFTPDNQPVPIAKYPNTKAHWRPTVSSIGSWTAHDRYVIFIKVDDDTSAPDLPALSAQVERMLDVQIPLLDKFQPTPADKLANIPLDPDGLLGRTLPTNPETPWRPDPDGTYAGRGVMAGLDSDPSLDFLTIGDLDLVAYGDATVFRSRTDQGAQALWQKWTQSEDTENRQSVEAPKGVDTEIRCSTDKPNSNYPEYQGIKLCMFKTGRYLVQAVARQIQDLHQKILAQYTLLQAR
ncbi:DUF7373 family lipoprotein [Nocardia mexicana]|nr:hypothetical protein [Nocardia mexicana]